jgi:hypothetical protein
MTQTTASLDVLVAKAVEEHLHQRGPNERTRISASGHGLAKFSEATPSPLTFADLVTRLEATRERLTAAVGGLSVGIERLTGDAVVPTSPPMPVDGTGQIARAHGILSDCFQMLDLLDEIHHRLQRQL